MIRKTLLLAVTLSIAYGAEDVFGQSYHPFPLDNLRRQQIEKTIRWQRGIKTDEELALHIRQDEHADPTEFCSLIPTYSECVAKTQQASRQRQEQEAIRQKEAAERAKEWREEQVKRLKFPSKSTSVLEAVSYKLGGDPTYDQVSIVIGVRCRKAGVGYVRLKPTANKIPQPTKTETVKCTFAEDVIDVNFSTEVADSYVFDLPVLAQQKK